MLYNAASLVKKGLLKSPPHVQFVLGIPNATPARRSIFDFLRAEIADVLPARPGLQPASGATNGR